MGVQAVFGPSNPILGAHIHSICVALDIPNLETRVEYDTGIREFSINLHPTQYLVNNAFHDVIKFFNWTKLAIIYEQDFGLMKLRDLARAPGLEVHVHQADPSSYGIVMRDIKNKDIHNILVDTRPEHMTDFLKTVSYQCRIKF